MAAISGPTQALIDAASTAKTASDAAADRTFDAHVATDKPSTLSEVVAKYQATITAQNAAIEALVTDIGGL